MYKAIIDDDIDDTLDSKTRADIDLLVEDGPLLQIQQKTKTKEAWDSLKTLYSLKGFTSKFLTCKEFFGKTLEGQNNSIEDYLNKVKQLSDQLTTKGLSLLIQVTIA